MARRRQCANEELAITARPCTVFERSEMERQNDDKSFRLIPLNGDQRTMIDRFDCRIHLTNVDTYAASPSASDEQMMLTEDVPFSACFEDLDENWQGEAKRKGAEIPFSYDSTSDPELPGRLDANEALEEMEEGNFTPAPELKVPKGVVAPTSERMHKIIERTALLVANHGSQMEIIVNIKQKNNKQFRFLDWNHSLHLYYKHLLGMIKSKRYVPVVEKRPEEDASSSESENDDYLHPSLRGASVGQPDASVQSISGDLFSSYSLDQGNDVYSELYKGLVAICPELVNANAQENALKEELLDDCQGVGENWSTSTKSVVVVPPSPDLQPIIDRFAEYVARNGPEFERMVRMKNEARFSFINPNTPYHAYYKAKVQWYQYEDMLSQYNQGLLSAEDLSVVRFSSYVLSSGKPVEHPHMLNAQETSRLSVDRSTLDNEAPQAKCEESFLSDGQDSEADVQPESTLNTKAVADTVAVIYPKEKEEEEKIEDNQQTPDVSEQCSPQADRIVSGSNDDSLDAMLDKAVRSEQSTDEIVKMQRRERAKRFLQNVKVKSRTDDKEPIGRDSSNNSRPVEKQPDLKSISLPSSYKKHLNCDDSKYSSRERHSSHKRRRRSTSRRRRRRRRSRSGDSYD